MLKAGRRWRLAVALLALAAIGITAGRILRGPAPLATTPQRPSILSHGSRIDAELFTIDDGAPRPLVVFLHGYPGGARNADLARAVHAAGYPALLFTPRGMKPSDGQFSFARSLEDVDAVLAWARTPAIAAALHLDPARIALVGHSFGGWQALLAARQERPDVCVAAIAAWNIGWVGARVADDPAERARNVEEFRIDDAAGGGPVSADPEALVAEMAAHGGDWNYLEQAVPLAAHPLLLVAATSDTPDEDVAMHAALAAAVRNAGGSRLRSVTYDDDHLFSGHRQQLSELLVDWLGKDCAAAWPAASGPVLPQH